MEFTREFGRPNVAKYKEVTNRRNKDMKSVNEYVTVLKNRISVSVERLESLMEKIFKCLRGAENMDIKVVLRGWYSNKYEEGFSQV